MYGYYSDCLGNWKMRTNFTWHLVNQLSYQKISFSPDSKHTDGTGDSGLLHDWQLQETNTNALESERSNELCKARQLALRFWALIRVLVHLVPLSLFCSFASVLFAEFLWERIGKQCTDAGAWIIFIHGGQFMQVKNHFWKFNVLLFLFLKISCFVFKILVLNHKFLTMDYVWDTPDKMIWSDILLQ